MKKIINSTIALLAGLSVLSCQQKEETAQEPEFDKITESVTAEPSGGHYEIEYLLSNPVEGLEVKATSEQDWIDGFTYGEGVIGFEVGENPSASLREGSVSVTYGTLGFSVPVTQQAEGDEEEALSFEFQLRDMTSTGVTIDVLPSDKTVYYFWNILEKTLVEEKYSEDEVLSEYAEQIIAQELEDFRNYVDQNGSWVDILSYADDLYRTNVLDPSTEYQIFAFGVNEQDGTIDSEVTRENFTTQDFKIQDNCQFEIVFDEVLQTEMTFTVKPDNPSTRWFVGVCPASMVETDGLEELSLQFIRQADVAGIDWAAHSSLNSGNKTVNTFEDMGITDMQPGVSYAIVVFGVSSLGERTTEIGCVEQTLPEVVESDMTFDISLVEQTESGAILRIIPSVKDEPYIAGCMQYQQYSEYVGKDEEFMQYVVDYGGMGVYEGDQTLDRSTALISDTRYVCFAFGYSGGITTPLTVYEFMTGKPDVSGSAEVEFVRVEIIDGAQVGYEGQAAVYAYMTVNDDAAHWYGQVMNSENGVCVGNFGITFTDTELIELLMNPNNDAKYTDSEYVATVSDWGSELTFFAIAEDADGNLGPFVKKTVIVER